ncbi:MAG TPA: DUF1850 domain-containing protein [Syntrophales bacterium]|jgi:hypothetical protein|nr:DUF1850 domain-containing protein [Syntrophales bacterium]HOX94203.1 DUF1850 domain-containing protein [Syntrophales bacterium]HPI57707.1 DUF1850 domain-containing protein [Syntrophales bacterium]HPN23940.1 DUF1850 domain-containing protein [Syntrophales bacterium]HQM28218.1 DUF1850 domain-containing protein [Syntrophales bacterium]
MKKRNRLAAVVLIITVLAAALWVRLDVLRVEAVRGGGTVLLVLAKPGDTFALAYTHSVERSFVRDFFRIDDGGRLILYGTQFYSLNTGLPSTISPGEILERVDGAFRISGMHRVMEEIPLWVAGAYGNTLTLRGADYDLPSLAGDTLLRIRTGRVTVGEYLFFKLKHLGAR